jgi:hypothetical protein
VNEAWSTQYGILSDDPEKVDASPISVVCDGDGDLVRQMGLSDDMGFGVGVRSMRFCMVVKNQEKGPVLTTLLTDEGMSDCSNTKAESLLRVLSPDDAGSDVLEGLPDITVLGAGAMALLLVGALLSGGGGSSSPTSAPSRSRPAIEQIQPGKKKDSFPMLKEYM